MASLKNPKHEYFAQGIVKGQSQIEAYGNAGYKPSEQHACRLASLGKVQDRIAELQERAAVRCEVTVASLTEMLLEDRLMAREIAQPSASVAAVNAIAKLNGLIIEKTENTNKQVDNMSDADLADIARTGSAGASKEKSSTKGSNPLH